MTTVIKPTGNKTLYVDSKFKGNKDELVKLLHQSTTLYVGNLSFYTTEEQIYELFSKCGPIRRIIMGLNRDKKTPCGFCFVEYYKRESALDCLKYIDKTKLDSRTIRVDLDYGFCKDRNLGRGKRGGQVRDDHRLREDSGFSSGQRIHPQDGFPYFGKSYGYQDFGYRRQKRQRPKREYESDSGHSSKRAYVETESRFRKEEEPEEEEE